MSECKVLLITGAGSGMGQETALHLAGRGHRVFGGVLTDAEAEELSRLAASRKVSLCPVLLDITDTARVECVVAALMAETGRIDGLVHFAGLGLRGFFEDLELDEIRRVYEVNVFGMMALTQAVLPHMRAQRSGRIVITSSAAGRLGTMTISGYCSSKFAIEGFAECLAQEVEPLGIQVSVLEPGLIQTPHFSVNRNRGRRAVDPASPYYLWFCQHEHIVDQLLARGSFTTADVACVVERILATRRPRLRYMVGSKLKLVVTLRKCLPESLFERIYWGAVRRMVTSPKRQVTQFSERS